MANPNQVPESNQEEWEELISQMKRDGWDEQSANEMFKYLAQAREQGGKEGGMEAVEAITDCIHGSALGTRVEFKCNQCT